MEEGGTPAGGTIKRDAGEGSHTVAPPWTKYHNSQTGRGRVISRGRASLDEEPQKPRGPCRSRRRRSSSPNLNVKSVESLERWIEWPQRREPERDPHGANRVDDANRKDKQGNERESAPCVCVIDRSGPVAVGGTARFRMHSCHASQASLSKRRPPQQRHR